MSGIRGKDQLGPGPFTRTLLVARGLDQDEDLLERVGADLVVPADLALRHLLDQYFSTNLRQNLHIAVHPSPVLVAVISSRVDSPAGAVGCCCFRCTFRGRA